MIVAKIGGSRGVNLEAVCEDAAALINSGQKLVIVHGASHATDTLAGELNHPQTTITSPSGHTSRRTDARTLEIFTMACALMNQRLVAGLQRRGVHAVGLSGVDGRLWEGERKAAVRALEGGRTVIIRDDYTGTVERVNAELLRTLLGAGFSPVISPPAISTSHEPINVDADRAAAQTAAALRAESLLLLSNVPGLLRNFPDESSLVARVDRGGLEEAAELAQGRMKKKVMGAAEALNAGVRRVVIGDARRGRPISDALAGAGTVLG